MKIHLTYVEMDTNGLDFASTESYYQILISTNNTYSYMHWSLECEGQLSFLLISY